MGGGTEKGLRPNEPVVACVVEPDARRQAACDGPADEAEADGPARAPPAPRPPPPPLFPPLYFFALHPRPFAANKGCSGVDHPTNGPGGNPVTATVTGQVTANPLKSQDNCAGYHGYRLRARGIPMRTRARARAYRDTDIQVTTVTCINIHLNQGFSGYRQRLPGGYRLWQPVTGRALRSARTAEIRHFQ